MDSQERWREDDAAALAERLAALRLLSHDIAEAVAAIPDPESFLDGERAAKAVIHADRMLARLPDDDDEDDDDEAPDDTAPLSPAHPTRSPQRLKLRTTADRVLAAIHAIPRPDSFIEADRAARCVLAAQVMLAQLYTELKPGKAKPTFVDDVDDDNPEYSKYPDPKAALLNRIDRYTRIAVEDHGGGVWPDGTAYDRNTPTDEVLFEDCDASSVDRAVADFGDKDLSKHNSNSCAVLHIILGRVNWIVRAHAERTGKWPNGKPYRSNDPDYYFVASEWLDCALGRKIGHPTADEQNLPGFPWWLVSRKPGYPDTG